MGVCCALGGTRSFADSCSAPYAALDKVESLLERGDGASYAQAAKLLHSAPIFIDDAHCNPSRYAMQRVTVSLHLLEVGAHDGKLDAHAADAEANKVWQAFVEDEHPARNTPQWQQATQYLQQLDAAGNTDNAEAHAPTGPNCPHPNVPPEVETLAKMGAESNQATDREGNLDLGKDADLKPGRIPAVATVHLSETGEVLDAQVTQSTGHAGFDAALLKAARETRYFPAVANCKNVPSVFLYRVVLVVLNAQTIRVDGPF